jgi:hypothetical protein
VRERPSKRERFREIERERESRDSEMRQENEIEKGGFGGS